MIWKQNNPSFLWAGSLTQKPAELKDDKYKTENLGPFLLLSITAAWIKTSNSLSQSSLKSAEHTDFTDILI